MRRRQIFGRFPTYRLYREFREKSSHCFRAFDERVFVKVSIHCWSVWLFCLIYNCNVFFIDLHYSVIKLSFNVWRTNPLSLSAHSPLSQFDMYSPGETLVFCGLQFLTCRCYSWLYRCRLELSKSALGLYILKVQYYANFQIFIVHLWRCWAVLHS